MKIDSLQKLYVEELRDIFNAEKQALKALPKLAKAAKSPELKAAFITHLEETRGQVERLERIFEGLGKKGTGKTCKAMQGLVEEATELLGEDIDPSLLDVGLIAAAQKMEHYEIAGYGSVRTYATLLGEDEAAKLLQQTLDEEGATDKKLTALAESSVNVEAA